MHSHTHTSLSLSPSAPLPPLSLSRSLFLFPSPSHSLSHTHTGVTPWPRLPGTQVLFLPAPQSHLHHPSTVQHSPVGILMMIPCRPKVVTSYLHAYPNDSQILPDEGLSGWRELSLCSMMQIQAALSARPRYSRAGGRWAGVCMRLVANLFVCHLHEMRTCM